MSSDTATEQVEFARRVLRWMDDRMVALSATRNLRPIAYRRHHFLTLVGFIVLTASVLPVLAGSQSAKYQVNLWLVYSIAGIGFYWVFGLAGRFAFCQTFMMALGGYMGAWVAKSSMEAGIFIQVLAAMVLSAVVAAVVGLIVRRAQDFYFAIATIAVAEMGRIFFTKATWFTGMNGTVTRIPPIEIFGTKFTGQGDVFWVFLVVLSLVLVVAILIERSPLRRDAVASRDNKLVASVVGVGTECTQLVLFILGSSMGGLAGALMGPWTRTTSQYSFGLDLAIGIFLILLLGGAGSMWGPVIGAAFYVAVPEMLSGLEKYSTVAYGVILTLTIIFMPEGIVGAIHKLRFRVDRARHRIGARTAPVATTGHSVLADLSPDDESPDDGSLDDESVYDLTGYEDEGVADA